MPQARSIARKVIAALWTAYSSDAACKQGLIIAAVLMVALLTIWVDNFISGLARSAADR